MSEHATSSDMLPCVHLGCPIESPNISNLRRHLKTHRFFFCCSCCEKFDSKDILERHLASPCPKHCIASHARSEARPLTERIVLSRRHKREPGCPAWSSTDRAERMERWCYIYSMYHFNGVGKSKPRCPPTTKIHAANRPGIETALAMDELQRSNSQIAYGLPADAQPYEMLSVDGLESRNEFPATQAVSTSFGQTEAMIVELTPSQLSQLALRAPEAGAIPYHNGVMYAANVPTMEPPQPSYYFASSYSGPNGFTAPQEPYLQVTLGQTPYVASYTQGSTADIDVTFDSISLEPCNIEPRSLREPQSGPEESLLIQGYFNAVQPQWPGDIP